MLDELLFQESEINSSNEVHGLVLDKEGAVKVFHEALTHALAFLLAQRGGCFCHVALAHACF